MFREELEKKYNKNNRKLSFIAFEENSFLLSVINLLKGYQKFLDINNNRSDNKYLFILSINNDINKNEENKETTEMIEKLVENIKINYGQNVIELYKEKNSNKNKKIKNKSFNNQLKQNLNQLQ